MNRHLWKSQLTPYEQDYARWCAEQGALLRAGTLDALDRENLAEEIESLGRSDKREIENRLKSLLIHLLKWQFQPERRSPSWRSTIREQRRRLAKIIKESPSLKSYDSEVLEEEFSYARGDACGETGLPIETFPEVCPYTIEQIHAPDFLPES